MKMTVETAKTLANEMAYSDYRINAGVDRKTVTKDWTRGAEKRTYIKIYCYTLAGNYKGNYDCGYVDQDDNYHPGEINLEDAIPAEPTAESIAEPETAAEATTEPETAAETTTEAPALKYTVNDTTSYGIYNGFREDDIDSVLAKAGVPESVRLEYINAIRRTLADDLSIKDSVMAYYQPFPLCAHPTDEWRRLYPELVTSREAAGVCDVPYGTAETLIVNSARDVFRAAAQKEIESLHRRISRMTNYVCATEDDVARKTKAYNDLHNEGGYGWVPPYCTQTLIDNLNSELEFWISKKED